jgi:polar amino acid transport system substrate-binding protein
MLALPLASAWGQCSRPIRVPVAPVGLSVITQGGEVSGVYPDLLRSLGAEMGCRFDFQVVPRARLEAMFVAGTADLLLPASRTPARESLGQFVQLMQSRSMLLSLRSSRDPVASLAQLRERRELRVVLVRGFDYGEAYQSLLQELRAQKRLLLEADPLAVARALERGLADVTVMSPSILIGALLAEPRQRALVERLRMEAVPELGWGESGVYLSRGLGDQDRVALTELLERGARSGQFWKNLQRYYPAGSFEDSFKPR